MLTLALLTFLPALSHLAEFRKWSVTLGFKQEMISGLITCLSYIAATCLRLSVWLHLPCLWSVARAWPQMTSWQMWSWFLTNGAFHLDFLWDVLPVWDLTECDLFIPIVVSEKIRAFKQTGIFNLCEHPVHLVFALVSAADVFWRFAASRSQMIDRLTEAVIGRPVPLIHSSPHIRF